MKKRERAEVTVAMRQGWNFEVAIQNSQDAAQEVSIIRDRIRKEQREEWKPLLEMWLFIAERQAELAHYNYLLCKAFNDELRER